MSIIGRTTKKKIKKDCVCLLASHDDALDVCVYDVDEGCVAGVQAHKPGHTLQQTEQGISRA